MWGPGRTKSNVWVAEVQRLGDELELVELRQVRRLPGAAPPFTRLKNYLSSAGFKAAAIDAPFSVPKEFVPEQGHQALLETVDDLPCPERPFPKGEEFFSAVTGGPERLKSLKPLRETEDLWKKRGIEVRSTLWTGRRGGAPMTSACLKLLAGASFPIWPWDGRPGCAVEAFPAAQLWQWGLPHEGYNGKGDHKEAMRSCIVDGLVDRIDLGEHRDTMMTSADALDAVLCAFAAIAVTEEQLAFPPESSAKKEGWIGVHE
jgi:predicted nuclease with RNAse H fold